VALLLDRVIRIEHKLHFSQSDVLATSHILMVDIADVNIFVAKDSAD
jgi:hypothetical protein